METLRVIIPGLYGYRMDGVDGTQYWLLSHAFLTQGAGKRLVGPRAKGPLVNLHGQFNQRLARKSAVASLLLEVRMNSKKQLRTSRARNEAALARKILGYLERHPQAQDTLEGIAQWWLLEQEIRVQISRVKASLDWLVKGRLVARRRGVDGRIY